MMMDENMMMMMMSLRRQLACLYRWGSAATRTPPPHTTLDVCIRPSANMYHPCQPNVIIPTYPLVSSGPLHAIISAKTYHFSQHYYHLSQSQSCHLLNLSIYIYLSAVSRITQAARGSDEGRPNSLTSILQLSCLMHRNHRPYSNHVALQLAEYYVV